MLNHDPLFEAALVIARNHRDLLPTMLQRRLQIGFNQAKVLLDALVVQGVLDAPNADGQYPSMVCAAEDASRINPRDAMIDIPMVYVSGEAEMGATEGYYVLSPDDRRTEALSAAATRMPNEKSELFSDGDIFFLRDAGEITWLAKAVGTLVRPCPDPPAHTAHVYAVNLRLHSRITPPLAFDEVEAIIGEYPDAGSNILFGLRARDGRALLDFILADGRLEPSSAEEFRS